MFHKLLDSFEETFGHLQGWRYHLGITLLGAISALAMAPTYFFPVLFLSFPILMLSLKQSKGVKQAFLIGFLFSLGYFVCGLYWISYAMTVDFAQFWWALPFALFGLPLILSLVTAIPLALLRWYNPKSNWEWWIDFSLAWYLAEWIRGHIFTGFPWNLIGYTWAGDWTLPVLQLVSITGIYGLSFLTVLIATSLYAVRYEENSRVKEGIVGLFLLFIGLVIVLGTGRLQQSVTPLEGFTLRLVQPNIPQKDKWDPDKAIQNLRKTVALSAEPGLEDIDMVVWPETAVALMATRDQHFFQGIVSALLTPDQYLATGVLERSADDQGKPLIYNSLNLYRGDGDMVAAYAKHHLVPFGEYLPYREYWPVDPIASGGEMFTAGEGITTIKVPDLPSFSPLVCYEIIFSKRVINPHQSRPDFILNVTNDAWYGNTSGPRQHLAMARVRAIEEGVTVVRVANTGITALFDPMGRRIGAIPLDKSGILDVPIYVINKSQVIENKR